MSSNPDHSRIPALDGVRGLAILWVVLHNSMYFEFPFPNRGLTWIIAVIAASGWIGVQIFFVLSGFLITGNLLDSQRAENYYPAFFGRRILRIFPLYYSMLLVLLVLLPLLAPSAAPPGNRADQIWLWVFLFNWFHPLGASTFGLTQFWSLAVEEQFYLLWPFTIHRLRLPTVAKVCAGLIVTALIVRIAMRLGGANPDMVYEFTVCRMDALALGALAAVAVRTPTVFSNLRHRAAWLMPSALMLLLVGATFTRAYARDGFWTQTAGQSLLAIVSGLLILACLMDRTGVNGWVQRIFASPVLRSLGKYSYGMYVIHLPLELILKRDPWYAHGNSGILAYGGAILGASYLAAVLSYHLIEKHFLKLKDRFVPQTLERAPKGVPHAAADC